MIPIHASFLNSNWGWEYGAILRPVECARGDRAAHCRGQTNQTQLRQKSQSSSGSLTHCSGPQPLQSTWQWPHRSYLICPGKLRVTAFYEAWYISEKTWYGLFVCLFVSSLTRNLALSIDSYHVFFSDGVQPYEIEVTSSFQRRKLRFT